MLKATQKALEHSITKKWEPIVANDGIEPFGGPDCALCVRFDENGDCIRRNRLTYGFEVCPVAIATGRLSCTGTPYRKWDSAAYKPGDKLRRLAQAELDFLKSLRPNPVK